MYIPNLPIEWDATEEEIKNAINTLISGFLREMKAQITTLQNENPDAMPRLEIETIAFNSYRILKIFAALSTGKLGNYESYIKKETKIILESIDELFKL